ncbi:putative diacylglycerol O-acyltransferase [compost metagenome]
MPITGSPWLMTSLASLYGRSNLARRVPPAANVLISNVPGPGATLYVAGARMMHFYPVSIPYHGSALNITVQSYAGSLDFGLTACRRILSQEESYELIGHLRAALRQIERLPSVESAAKPAVAKEAQAEAVPAKAPRRAKAPAAAKPRAAATAAAPASKKPRAPRKPAAPAKGKRAAAAA